MLRVGFIAANWDRSWATEYHVARELELLGHTVARFDERVLADWRPSNENGAYDQVLAEADGLDLMLYMAGVHIDYSRGVALWKELEARGVKTASYHLDLYVGLPRQSEVGTTPFWRTGTVFTADGDPASTTTGSRPRCSGPRLIPVYRATTGVATSCSSVRRRTATTRVGRGGTR